MLSLSFPLVLANSVFHLDTIHTRSIQRRLTDYTCTVFYVLTVAIAINLLFPQRRGCLLPPYLQLAHLSSGSLPLCVMPGHVMPMLMSSQLPRGQSAPRRPMLKFPTKLQIYTLQGLRKLNYQHEAEVFVSRCQGTLQTASSSLYQQASVTNRLLTTFLIRSLRMSSRRAW
jgi:hypothetical protein